MAPIAIRVAVDLGIPDLLAARGMTTEEVSTATGCHAPSVNRLLRALAVVGLVSLDASGSYELTALAQALRGDHPLSLRDAYAFVPSELRAWAEFHATLRGDGAAFHVVHGVSYWDYLAAHGDESLKIDRAMESYTRMHLRTVLPAYDWAQFQSIVDVGGGNGSFLAGLLTRHPTARGVLLDLPHVVANAPAVLDAVGVADRCEIVAASFFDHVPAGADGYVVKTVLPALDDDHAAALLANVRDAMPRGGRVVLLEAILPPGDVFDVAKLVDVQMMVLAGGQHRTTDELAALLERVSMRLVRAVPTATLTVVEAVAA